MAVYAKKTTNKNPIFHNRVNSIATMDENWRVELKVEIPIPDSLVLCNGCNENIPDGFLVYLDKTHLKNNQCYDIYCEKCLKEYFPKAQIVE